MKDKTNKFIMMNLDDARSKKVAEVLGNKTCKKIVDYLSETNEASEKDIADALNIPINTAEYNLKKLIQVGLVDKTKNFFWSRKGKKIPMYKLAKKHIIISPRSSPSLNSLKTILPVIAVVAALFALILLSNPTQINENELNKFNSLSELKNFLKENQGGAYYRSGPLVDNDMVTAEAGVAADKPASEYSQTNIQVEGVDEPDIVKNDGKYIYAVSGNKVMIINAFPAQNMEIISELEIENYISNIFINEDRLIIFTNNYDKQSQTEVFIYDTSDKYDPEIENTYTLPGHYNDARMMNDYIYVISTKYIDTIDVELPLYKIGETETLIPINEIYYFNSPDSNYVFSSITAIKIDGSEFENKVYLTGASHNLYVSENNIYLTYTKQPSSNDYFEQIVEKVFLKILPSSEKSKAQKILDSDKNNNEKMQAISEIIEDYSRNLNGEDKEEFDQELMEKMQEFQTEFQKQYQKTIIHKIKVDKEDIEYLTTGEVPGVVLNQFSMDEYGGDFRIATTTGNSWNQRDSSLNHLYVLDKDLDIIGSITDLAEGERIYSTRFIGERAYMVTFRQVDPLFVLDLSDPENPKELGQLKVTGFSNYLHPYDENHIIGIGKEATEEGRVQGVKIALFDVSDVENPIEKAKYEVTDGKWSDSNALYDHKAFLFDKSKNLLVLPISYNQETGFTEQGYPRYKYWQGAFVFDINKNKISLRGKVEHVADQTEYNYNYRIQRSLYMEDTLYTISSGLVKANDLNTLEEINKVKIPIEQYRNYIGIE